jgi:hypothetical protein
MLGCGESQKEMIRPDFNRSIMVDFQGATISSDTGFILLREVEERFRIIPPMKDCLEDLRLPTHTKPGRCWPGVLSPLPCKNLQTEGVVSS